jgi:hypothetical protein
MKSLQEDLQRRDQLYEEAMRHQNELKAGMERMQAEKEAEKEANMRKQNELKAEVERTLTNKEAEMRDKLLQLEVSQYAKIAA